LASVIPALAYIAVTLAEILRVEPALMPQTAWCFLLLALAISSGWWAEKSQLLERAADVFAGGTERGTDAEAVPLKELQRRSASRRWRSIF
jgi:hypothetical protein